MFYWQAIVMMLEDGHERVMSLMKDLFQFFSKTNFVTPVQMKSVSFWTHDKIPYIIEFSWVIVALAMQTRLNFLFS